MKVYSNEIVFRGHPDKVCDQISDALLDAYLIGDKNSRVAAEAMGGKGYIFITGEVTSKTDVDVEKVVRRVLDDVGYNSADYIVVNNIGVQSPDISQGVDTGGAGDQGMMFGYACDDTKEMLPKAMIILQKFSKFYDELRQNDNRFLADGKAQITGIYDDEFIIEKIKTFTISYQNTELERDKTDEILKGKATELAKNYGLEIEEFLINPTGKFLVGGFEGDSGLCLSADTLISTKLGLVKIKNLKKGSTVYTESGTAKITEYHRNDIKPTKIIEDERGLKIEATYNHPFRIWNGEEIIWKEAGAITKGDFLVKKRLSNIVTRKNPITSLTYSKFNKDIVLKYNKDFAYILGWLVGDGNTTADDRITFYYGSEEEKEHLYNELSKVFPTEEIKWYSCQDDRFYILSKDLVRQIKSIGVSMKKQPEREVPEVILGSSDFIKKAFLSGLFDSDGCIKTGTGRDLKHVDIRLTTSSERLSQQVGVILTSLKIQFSIYTSTSKGHYKSDGGFIIGGTRYDIIICGLFSIGHFVKNIGFRIPAKNKKCQTLSFSTKWRFNDFREYPIYSLIQKLLNLDTRKKRRYFENYDCIASEDKNRKYQIESIEPMLDMYEEHRETSEYQRISNIINNFDIVEVESVSKGEADTYDITLDDNTHSFIANGFIVHNTGRKIVADAYQSFANVGGGAYSGKDSSKVDRSGAYKARQIAKRMLKKHNLKWCEVQLSYAIGVAEPLAIYIDSNKGNILATDDDYKECTPERMIKDLNLKEPIFEETARFGHYGNGFSWDKEDAMENVGKKYIKIKELITGYSKDKGMAYSNKLCLGMKTLEYDREKAREIIKAIMNGSSVGVVKWEKIDDKKYELIEGQEVIMAICKFLTNNYTYENRRYHELSNEEIEKILNFEIEVDVCGKKEDIETA